MRVQRSLTTSLIILISACFLIAAYFPTLTNPPVQEQLFLIRRAILSDGAVHGVATGEWWRLITVALTHGGWTHLIFNMLALYSVGLPVEMFYGRLRYSIIFITSLVTASAASLFFNPENVPAVGASGAIFGLFAAMLVTGRRMGVEYRSVGGVIVVNLLLTFAIPNIDWHAHVGGLAGGALAAYLIKTFATRQR
ncbi:MAG: rhomboid family intramembrane serine protease [Actinomycetes bacterium]